MGPDRPSHTGGGWSTSTMFPQAVVTINSFVWETTVKSDNSPGSEPLAQIEPTRPLGVWLLLLILAGQGIGLAWVLGLGLTGLAEAEVHSMPSAIFELALLALGVVWLALTVVGLYRMRPWSRASVIAIEVLFIAVGLGMTQGVFADPALASLLALPGLIALVLLFTPQVVAVLSRIRSADGSAEEGADAG